MNYVVCNSCGWVHYPVTLDKVTKETRTFNKYFDNLSQREQLEYYGGKRVSLLNYIKCFKCGTLYTEMRKAKNTEVPVGSTIQPILSEEVENGK